MKLPATAAVALLSGVALLQTKPQWHQWIAGTQEAQPGYALMPPPVHGALDTPWLAAYAIDLTDKRKLRFIRRGVGTSDVLIIGDSKVLDWPTMEDTLCFPAQTSAEQLAALPGWAADARYRIIVLWRSHSDALLHTEFERAQQDEAFAQLTAWCEAHADRVAALEADLHFPAAYLRDQRHLNRAGFAELVARLEAMGVRFDTRVDEWYPYWDANVIREAKAVPRE